MDNEAAKDVDESLHISSFAGEILVIDFTYYPVLARFWINKKIIPAREALMLRMNSVRAFLLFSKIRIFAANIDHISNGRFTLNVVSAWWEEEGGIFT